MILHRDLCEDLFRQVKEGGNKHVRMDQIAKNIHTAEIAIYKKLKDRMPDHFTATRKLSTTEASVRKFFMNMEYPFAHVCFSDVVDADVPADITALPELAYCKLEDYYGDLNYVYFQANGRIYFKPTTGSTYFVTGYQKPVIPYWGGIVSSGSRIIEINNDDIDLINSYIGSYVLCYDSSDREVYYISDAYYSQGCKIVHDRDTSDEWRSSNHITSVSTIPDEYEAVIRTMVLAMQGVENKGLAAIASGIMADAHKHTGKLHFTNPPELF